jgi:hypothetical protein
VLVTDGGALPVAVLVRKKPWAEAADPIPQLPSALL